MSALSMDSLAAYWSQPVVEANIVVFFNLLGALLLGLLVGYERSYHGRAAGMRTYGLVCLASCALTVIVGYPELWFGGHNHGSVSPDVTRVIQGIVTGIGFLCAGVIIKEGFTISGLTTAASIWTASAIGVLVGIGFYAAAILLALMSAIVMMWISRLEAWLPSRHAIAVVLTFEPDFAPDQETLENAMRDCHYTIAGGSLVISANNGRQEWHFVAITLLKNNKISIPDISKQLTNFTGVSGFRLSFARN
ncbi:MAG: MgtC/SapB family protein [Methylococcales bacterium]